MWPGIDFTSNLITLRLWVENSGGPLNSEHLGFGLGTIFGPFIARPFLSPDELPPVNCYVPTCHDTTAQPVEPPSSRFPEGSQIEIPYAIVGSIWAAVASLVILLHKYAPLSKYIMTENSKTHTQDKKGIEHFLSLMHPESCANGSNICAGFFSGTIFLFSFS